MSILIFLMIVLPSFFFFSWHKSASVTASTTSVHFIFQQTNMNPGKSLMSLILNMRFQLTEGNWQRVSRACSVLSASLSNKINPYRSPSEIQPATFDIAQQAAWLLENITRGPQKYECACVCGCMCNLTVPFLSLMSHQCTQCASAFSELEYINTSVYQVILHLQAVEWGWDGTVQHLFLFLWWFMMERSFSLVSK